ncbi:hypothetical protein NAL32_18115 [Chryseobacterium sp. Ch-15]|uniref:Uncharacterized protein n=1 Tax=Chryseobacterium muglaense TaxID=2893752 RepID=A0A9Q3YQT8_9FLAO|nr:hypothetical protein [Chryseobacterium muglaense]MBD3906550.1 hypothetical protein [Chryseobacterium muglaense]MCC9034149.1 hypothetical protein [Chryseobacterium muglaense]MCM2556304.1 hypothetical protein [Chryseobacterium muglaense]
MKLYKKVTTFLLLLMILSLSAQEYDDARYEVVLKQLKLNSSKIHNQLYTEKKMPYLEDSYIIVVPVLLGKLEADGFSVKNTILITDSQGRINNKYIDATEFGSDAIMLDSFTIDTGLYKLNSNIRSFGVTANYRGSSGPNPYSSSDISLYYPEGKTLKKVLDNYNLRTYSGEWDMNCSGKSEEDNSVIIVDLAKTNGFANLKIKTEKIKKFTKEINNECNESKTSKISYKTLKFNKSVYQ